MSVKHVAWNVINVVFAGDGPAVGTIFPHEFFSEDPQVAGETSGQLALFKLI